MTARRSSADTAVAFVASYERRTRLAPGTDDVAPSPSETETPAPSAAPSVPCPVEVATAAAEPTAAPPPPALPPGTRICSRCRIRAAIPRRPGPGRCTECVAASPPKRERNRRYRDNIPRARTISPGDLAREVRMHAAVEPADLGDPLPARPVTRAECQDTPRPCPWAGCRHHLAIDINPETGAIKINFPDLEPWELKHTCALDVAEIGGITLEEVAEVLNLTRERVRQLEVRGLLKIKLASPSADEVGADLPRFAAPPREVPR